jgi:hypothetical protein
MAGLLIDDNITVSIKGNNAVLDAKQDPHNPGGRIFDAHGTLILTDMELKNAVGVNDGGAIYINGGRLELTRVTFTNCFGGADDCRFSGAFSGPNQQPLLLTDCKFTMPADSSCQNLLTCADSIGVGANATFIRTCPDGSVQTAVLKAGSYAAKDLPPTKEIVQCGGSASS